jgi:hypothetical protein
MYIAEAVHLANVSVFDNIVTLAVSTVMYRVPLSDDIQTRRSTGYG